jgi:hypothetical protein
VPGQENDGQATADFVQPSLDVDPIEFGHAHVEQYATCFSARRVCQELLAGFIECDLVTASPKQPSDRDAKRWIVVNYMDGCRSDDHFVMQAERITVRAKLRLSTQITSSEARRGVSLIYVKRARS